MEVKQAIISFSQSEKVKSGLIWCSQCVQVSQNLSDEGRQGAVQMISTLVAMIASEVQLARQVSKDDVWLEVEKILHTARVMINSGVSEEATHHFTQALSQVNRIGQRAMTLLIDKGLLA
jgi:hypothetical protein